MKTKEEILKMNDGELRSYKWSDDLGIKEDNLNCSACSACSDCSNLFNGLYCRNLKLKEQNKNKYWICNIEVTKEELENKLKELRK